MDFLALLEALNSNPTERGPARIAAVRELLGNVTDLDSGALLDAALDKFNELHTAGSATPEAIEQMHLCADVADALRAYEADANAALAAAQAEVDEIAARIAGPAAAADDTTDPGDATEGADGGDTAAAEPPAAPAAATQAPAAPSAALVPASSRGRLPLGRTAKHTPAKAKNYELRAAADIKGMAAGSPLDLDGLVKATQVRLGSLRNVGTGKHTAGIAEIHRLGNEFVSDKEETDLDVINAATNESRLPGGSLVAAGGWCAPSEVLYDFCDPAVVDGLVTLPRVTARRGGLRWPASPDFAALYAGTGFCYTEAEIIGQTTDKPCYEIECNSFNECRLGVCGVCVKVPILTQRGFPELVRYTLAQIMAAHEHRMNRNYLASMAAQSTAVTIPTGASPFSYGPGATATLLSAIELQMEYLRYKRRLGMNRTMEVKIPAFARGILRSDLAKRNGVDLLNVSDATLDGYFRTRKANVEYVLDWQDAYSDGVTPPTTSTLFGGPTPPLVWPATVSVMIYPSGTFFLASEDLISIEGLFDSALLARNMGLAVFTEEAWCVGKKCDESILLTVPVCANGATGEQLEVACPAV